VLAFEPRHDPNRFVFDAPQLIINAVVALERLEYRGQVVAELLL
jgi:hypothetical protein